MNAIPKIAHTEQMEHILALAEIEADRDKSGHVGVEHFIIAACQQGMNPLAELLANHGLTLERLRALDYGAVQPQST